MYLTTKKNNFCDNFTRLFCLRMNNLPYNFEIIAITIYGTLTFAYYKKASFARIKSKSSLCPKEKKKKPKEA